MKNQEQKTVIIPFRVTPAEKEKIEEMSYGHYKLMSDFIRECIFKKDIRGTSRNRATDILPLS